MRIPILKRARAAISAFFGGKTGRRGYDATQGGRLYADWFAQATSSDAEIRNSIRKLIDRSRDLERNNDYQRGFLLACERNVLGAIRADLRMDAGEYVFAKGKPPVWTPDRVANSAIELAWTEWSKKGTCTVCGKYSWRDVKRLAVRSTPRDGNFLARKIRGAEARNRFGFALQLWEIDCLDLQKFELLKGGNEIRFGIEMDSYRRPVAYWLFSRSAGDIMGQSPGVSRRFPAEDIYHLFVSERVDQSLGVPWVVSAITRLRQLGAFEEAATIAARLGATKAGFLKQTPGPNGEMGEFTGGVSASGNPIMEATPGSFEALPQGWSLDSWNPEYPNIETGDFRKAMLRGVGTSLGMSYNTLGNDLESVNFSSARVGLFEEREMWKGLQSWYSETFWEPVFADWLEQSILNAAVALPLGKFAKFNRPVFKARRWPFIDPLKEVSAAKEAIALRLSSRQQFIEESGGDRDDVFHDNLSDEQFAEEIGLSLAPEDPLPAPGSMDAEEPDDTAEGADPTPGKKPKRGAAPVTTVAEKLKQRLSILEARPTVPAAPIVVSPPTVNITMPTPAAAPAPAERQTLILTGPEISGDKIAEVTERDAKTGVVTKMSVRTKRESFAEYDVTNGANGRPVLTQIRK